MPAQNTERGTVVMTVTEGKVGVLRVKNSRYFDVDDIKKKAPLTPTWHAAEFRRRHSGHHRAQPIAGPLRDAVAARRHYARHC